MESSATVVIKVKYRDVLRRFETQFVDKGQHLSMDGLRSRIVSLFGFAPGTELMLTYIDEDNDAVNLVDDDDICDVIKQGLNPLRITVKVNSGNNGDQYPCLSGSSAPMRSPQAKQPLENLQTGVSEILRTLPEPLHETLVKVSTDLANKASSSAPGISELVDCLAKVGLSYLGQISKSQPGMQSSMQGGVSKRTGAPESKDLGLSKVNPAAPSGTQPVIISDKSSSNNDSMEGLKPMASVENEAKVPSATEVRQGSSPFDFSAVAAALESQNMNVALPLYDYLHTVPTSPIPNLSHGGRKEKFKKIVEMLPLPPVAYNAGKIAEPVNTSSNLPPVTNKVTTVEVTCNPNELNIGSNNANVGDSARKVGEYTDIRGITALHDNFGKSSGPILAPGATNKSPFPRKAVRNVSTLPPYNSFKAIVSQRSTSENDGFGKSAGPIVPTSAMNQCPFSGIDAGNVSSVPPYKSSEAISSMSVSQNNGCQSTVHHGITCDGCDFHPITGPRFKSKVKVYYDLCSTCFLKVGNDADYIRMDCPVVRQNHMSSIGGFGKSSDPLSVPGAKVCPFSGIALENVSTVPPCNSSEATSSRSFSLTDSCQNTVHHGITCDGCDVHPIKGLRFKSKVKLDYDLCSSCFQKVGNDGDYIRMDCPVVHQNHMSSIGGVGKSSDPLSVPGAKVCPFSGIALENVSTVPPCNSSEATSSRSFSLTDGCQNTVHHGITCDGCDVHPIKGLRFKSKVKEDYDLCSICFETMGCDAEYIRMDCPKAHQSRKSSVGGFGKSSGPLSLPGAMNECPFSGISLENVSTVPPCNFSEAISSRRSISQTDCRQNTVHHGITCDGCDVHPIKGLRFKSKVKVDYDLCSSCFEKMGNDADYIRMDFPVVCQSHISVIGGSHDGQATAHGPILPQVYSGRKVKPVAIKLDSCFVEDVNIIDDTVMAPLTPFTKIWRMKNNGAVGWLRGTQLVWIGGDKFSSALSIELQVPEGGVWMGQVLDVMVDFISPKLPGRYISYWRMATPSGEKFGQRVWVLIQVDASIRKTPRETIRNLNLNLPPVNSGLDSTEVINVEPEPHVKGSHAEPDNSKNIVELVQPETEQDLKFPIHDMLLVEPVSNGSSPSFFPFTNGSSPSFFPLTNGSSPSFFPLTNGSSPSFVPFTASSSVSYPIIDPSDVPPALSSVPYQQLPQTKLETSVATASHSAVDDLLENQVEEKLRELEEMGFKQTDLNKAILQKNEYSLELAVDELCGSAEWDSILEELKEMGFYDRETNKMLLKKNDGSIKRVVMDLIAGEMNE